MDGLVAGRIVYFVFDEHSAKEVKQQRALGLGHYGAGNEVHAGDVYPAMVVRTWASDVVNLKVNLDGPDTYWATSVPYAEWTPEAESLPIPRTWHWMFGGQATRHAPNTGQARP